MHAIIVDDEFNGIKVLELLIKKHFPDIKVVATTTDSIDGVVLINNFRPDIVFLDISMPGLSGFDLIEKLEYKNFHLIFTTAHREFAIKAIKKSATDYLLKPVDPDDLIASIERVKATWNAK